MYVHWIRLFRSSKKLSIMFRLCSCHCLKPYIHESYPNYWSNWSSYNKKTCIKVCKKLFLVMHLSMSWLTVGKEHNTTWKAKKIWTSDLWKSGFCLNSLKVLDNMRLIIHVLHHNFDFNNFTVFSWIYR